MLTNAEILELIKNGEDSTKQQPTTAELARLFQQRRLVAADEAPVPAGDIDDLDLPAINRYFLRLAQSELTVDNSQLLLRELINTGIMVETADGVLPTLADISVWQTATAFFSFL